MSLMFQTIELLDIERHYKYYGYLNKILKFVGILFCLRTLLALTCIFVTLKRLSGLIVLIANLCYAILINLVLKRRHLCVSVG